MEIKCKNCNHIWIPRTLRPMQCPRCKRYDWEIDIEKIEKIEEVKETN